MFRLRVVLAIGLGLMCFTAAQAEERDPAPIPIALTVGRTIRLQLPDKSPIRRVMVENEGVVRVTPLPDDRTTVLLTGIALGRARVIVVGENGKKMVCAMSLLRIL